MNNKNLVKLSNLYDIESQKIKKYSIIIIFLWTLVIISSLIWNLYHERELIIDLARIEAKSNYDKDIMYRKWASQHGGVYAPITDKTPPNPYLEHVPERDLTTPSGKRLTLINPAFMTRQVHELGARNYGYKGHITSLKPIRPQNAPDEWERKALEIFEQGKLVVDEIDKIEGQDYLRYMQALHVEESCLKCHAAQGYKVGDIRGGISVSIPMNPFYEILNSFAVYISVGHSGIWFLGILITLGGVHRINNQLKKQHDAELALEKSEHHYRLLAENSSDAVSLIDSTGKLIYISPAYKKILGYAPNEDVAINADTIISFIHPEDQEIVKSAWIQNISDLSGAANKLIGQTITYRIKTKAGDYIWIEDLLTPEKISDGAGVRIIVNSRNVTDRKLAEEKLKESLHEKELLLRELYHRTKNNMQVICAFLELESINVTETKTVELFRKIIDRIHSIALVHQHLYKSKNLSSIDLDNYVNELIANLYSSRKKNPEQIKVNLNIDQPFIVLIDLAVPLGLVMNELISNSFLHAFPDNRPGSISIHLHHPEPNRMVLNYQDNGIGFPPGTDFRQMNSLGFTLIVSLIEHQLRGKIAFDPSIVPDQINVGSHESGPVNNDLHHQSGFKCSITINLDEFKQRV